MAHYAILHRFGRNLKCYPTLYYNEWSEQVKNYAFISDVCSWTCLWYFHRYCLWFFALCRSTKYDHTKESLVHMLYHIQSIGQIPLEQFRNIILDSQYKKTLTSKKDVWYSLTKDAMIDHLYIARSLSFCFILKLNSCIWFHFHGFLSHGIRYQFVVRNICWWRYGNT
jgi:hypothetical protein